MHDLQRLKFYQVVSKRHKKFWVLAAAGVTEWSLRVWIFRGRDEAAEFTAGISSLSDAITPVGTEIWAAAPPPRRCQKEREGVQKDTAERVLEAHYSLSEAR